jgi:hypothetical protein
MRKSIYKQEKGNTFFFKHESEKRRFSKWSGRIYGYNRGHKWVCPDDRYGTCEYCLSARLHSSNRNIARADEMLLEEKYVGDISVTDNGE